MVLCGVILLLQFFMAYGHRIPVVDKELYMQNPKSKMVVDTVPIAEGCRGHQEL